MAVTITSVSHDNVLSFTGVGTWRRDSRGVHLRCTVRDNEGHELVSSVHLGAGMALVDNGSYRLLLDPARPTAARLGRESGLPELTVTTCLVRDDSGPGGGEIQLRYTLSAMERTLQTMQVTVALRPMERE